MDRSAKSFFAVSLLVIALLIITNLVINNRTPENQELFAALITLGGSIAFWVWLWLENRATVEAPTRPDDGTGALQLPQRQAQEWVISRQSSTAPAPGAIPHATLPFEPVTPVGHEHGEIPDEPAVTAQAAPPAPAAPTAPVAVIDEPLEPEIQPAANVLVTDEVPAVKIDAAPEPEVIVSEPAVVTEKLEPEIQPAADILVTDEVPAVKIDAAPEAVVTEPVTDAVIASEATPIAASISTPIEEKLEPEIEPIHVEVTDEVPMVKIEPQVDESPEGDTSHGITSNRESSATSAPTVEVSAVAGDDLTEIEGIGPKYNEILHSGGILTYAQLAISTKEELTAILHNAGSTRIPASVETWAEQAGYLSRDDVEGLRKFQAELVGGRRSGTGD
ncbi:MAG TPA: hypothetical protein VHL11_18945 [Phototrophicaceae bacterium]|jgi:predicted flap endonuclease-1-like 5' DNA nuclease|nr:hypothetical protein [Phototrophicaceae bacterium]